MYCIACTYHSLWSLIIKFVSCVYRRRYAYESIYPDSLPTWPSYLHWLFLNSQIANRKKSIFEGLHMRSCFFKELMSNKLPCLISSKQTNRLTATIHWVECNRAIICFFIKKKFRTILFSSLNNLHCTRPIVYSVPVHSI